VSVQGQTIIPPKDGWKESTWYLVNVSYNKGNPKHKSLFYSGFLTGKDRQPGGYNGLVPLNGPDYDEPPTEIHKVKYLRVIGEIIMPTETGPKQMADSEKAERGKL
jgi:hypothetical protein